MADGRELDVGGASLGNPADELGRVVDFLRANPEFVGALLKQLPLGAEHARPSAEAVTPTPANDLKAEGDGRLEAEPEEIKVTARTVKKTDAYAKCLYTTRRGMDLPVREAIILGWLKAHGERKVIKEDLFRVLSSFCDIGTEGSFATRLNDLRGFGWLTWTKRKQRQAIIMTNDGFAHLRALIATGAGGLTQAQLDCLREYVPELRLVP